jgi:hypothetical protein
MSNNPPDIELPLTHEEASLLLRHCESNVGQGLAILQEMKDTMPEDGLRKIADMIDGYSTIMKKLRKAGAKSDAH